MNIKKLAEITGYSVSTVSKAFSNKKDVSEQAKNEIFEKAKELGCYEKYSKENYDRKIVAVLCPEAHSQFYSKILSTLNDLIEERGGTMAISLTDFSKEKTDKLLRLYSANKRADGIISVSGGAITTNYSTVPIVSFSSTPSPYCDVINLDCFNGIYQAVQLLKSYSHTKIAFIGEIRTVFKKQNFVDAMKKADLPVDNDLILTNQTQRFEQAGFECMNELLSLPQLPTAVVTAYDNIALGAIQAIEKNGLKVPEDISVVGCDDMGVASYYKIALSSIDLGIEEGCKTAVDMLFNKILNPCYCITKCVTVNSTLKDRKTISKAKN